MVQKLDFSPNWIRGFLNRASFRQRRITTADKPLPSDEIIRATMKIGQDLYKGKNHSRKTNWNMDETAVTRSIGPLYIFCPTNQQRACDIGISNTKLRITAAITVNSDGEFAPFFFYHQTFGFLCY